MGQFIRLRLTNELYVLEKDRWRYAYDSDRITDILDSWFNMQLHDAEELEDSIPSILEEDMFQEYLLSFLMEQTQIMHDSDTEEIKEEVEALESRSLSDYMKWIKENRMPSCLWYGKCTIVSPPYCSEKLYMSAGGVDYLVEGKAVVGCYDSLFTYIHNVIRKASVNPLENTVAVPLD